MNHCSPGDSLPQLFSCGLFFFKYILRLPGSNPKIQSLRLYAPPCVYPVWVIGEKRERKIAPEGLVHIFRRIVRVRPRPNGERLGEGQLTVEGKLAAVGLEAPVKIEELRAPGLVEPEQQDVVLSIVLVVRLDDVLLVGDESVFAKVDADKAVMRPVQLDHGQNFGHVDLPCCCRVRIYYNILILQ